MLPMQLCGTDTAPLLAEPERYRWLIKYDGFRAQLHVGSGVLCSRQGNALAAAFPDAVEAARLALGERDVVLDCELVTLDNQARPDFEALSARSGCRGRAAERAAARTPAVLVAFDLLVADGVDVRELPWSRRSQALQALALPQSLATGTPALVCAPATDDGLELLAATADLRLEGCVAARRDAPYRPGRANWIKVKHPWARDLQAPTGWRRTA